MIYNIPVPNTPNVTFSSLIDGNSFVFTLREFRDLTFATIDIGGNRVVSGVRVCPNMFLIDKGKDTDGNFLFYCPADGTYPSWENFNGASQLIYVDADSMAEYYSELDIWAKDSAYLKNWIEGRSNAG